MSEIKHIRIKQKGAEVLQIDVSSIKCLRVLMDPISSKDYYLLLNPMEDDDGNLAGVLVYNGTFDACHSVLNKINNALNIEVIDV